MNELSNEQVSLIFTILGLSKNMFFKVSTHKKFKNNIEYDEKLKQIDELEKIFGTVNNKFYYKNVMEEK